jgi:hypothetical protein
VKRKMYSYRVVIAQESDSARHGSEFGSQEDWGEVLQLVLEERLAVAHLVEVVPIRNKQPQP